MDARYFAYGSNLHPARMQERVPGARALGVARLAGHCLTWNKQGADGSGKANLRAAPAQEVWGVVYAFEAEHWSALDVCEGGYERIGVRVERTGDPHPASTYRSERLTTALPFAWYHRLVVEGARAHGLPEAWVRALAAQAARTDPSDGL